LRTKFLSLENVRTHDLGSILLFFAHEKNLVLESDFEREQIISEVETLKKKSKNAIN
tara:strand:- start:151 stop:321 length:171 start_codon:yes stop_codon:yes gene_type:complete